MGVHGVVVTTGGDVQRLVVVLSQAPVVGFLEHGVVVVSSDAVQHTVSGSQVVPPFRIQTHGQLSAGEAGMLQGP